jgi:hypothetical protein
VACACDGLVNPHVVAADGRGQRRGLAHRPGRPGVDRRIGRSLSRGGKPDWTSCSLEQRMVGAQTPAGERQGANQ